MATAVILFLLVVLFASIDVWYFLRFLHFILKVRIIRFLNKFGVGQKRSLKDMKDFLSPIVLNGIVMPSHIDGHMHMNNSKYLREMDFGRIKTYFESGMLDASWKLGAATLVAAISIRYRRSLQLWERFSLLTKVMHWNKDAFYLEQRFIGKDGFTCAIAMVKMVARSKDGRVSPAEIVKLMGGEGESVKSPSATPELKYWMESLEKSSKSMKKEGLSNSQKKDS